MMRPRFPLSAKILSWFFANLLLVGVAVYAFVEFEFHLGPESLLGGRAGRRADGLAALVSADIHAQPPSQWDDVLARAGNLYGLKLLLAGPDGRSVAGAEIPLPREVQERLFRPPHPPNPSNPLPQPPDPQGPPPLADGGQPPPGADQRFPPPGPRPGDHPDSHGPPRDHRMVHTFNPGRYWLLLPVEGPAPGPEGGHHPPLTLIAVSDSIGLGGLVLDFMPWIAAAGSIFLFSVLFWLPLVHGITRSIREMTGATARVAEGRFDIRVRQDRGDELGLLATSINQMAERLAGFVNGQKRFLGDIAHELCTPLARSQVALGILEQQGAGETLVDLREEIQQMSDLVNELLSFSKASLAAGRIKLQSVPLCEIIRRAAQREAVPDASLVLHVDPGLHVMAEPDLLCRAIANLLRNALKYAGEAGPVEIEAAPAGGDVILTVADHGPGVPDESLAQIFDPFYRLDVSRARETGGTGLGLAIVKTCVESCAGRVACRNRAPHGLSVAITLAAA
ncbi:MAG TPA: HAMP domain-containing sensor histidine kinase [Chthoniobacteraceae bacterium]|jgi:two-component system sensor histidine kinase CpxA|nr:HAMP domain-containing sensor histidine kinase [Chthoniobacteraceae bacterium]